MENHAVNNAKPLEGQVFYLDTKSFKYTDQLEICLRQLGGRVEKFLGKEVTGVISDRSPRERRSLRSSQQTQPMAPGPAMMSRGQRLLNKARHSSIEKTDSASSDLLTVAAQWNINIVSLKKILQLTKSFGFDVTKKENQLNQTRPVKLRKLHGSYIKFENSSARYKPCHMSFASFPVLHFENDKYAGSPFYAPLPSQKPAKVDVKIADDAPAPGNTKNDAGKPEVGEEKGTNKSTAKKKSDKQLQSGYCECCDDWYKELKSHVTSLKHQSFARNSSNYTSVDSLLLELPGIKSLLEVSTNTNEDISCSPAHITSDGSTNEQNCDVQDKIGKDDTEIDAFIDTQPVAVTKNEIEAPVMDKNNQQELISHEGETNDVTDTKNLEHTLDLANISDTAMPKQNPVAHENDVLIPCPASVVNVTEVHNVNSILEDNPMLDKPIDEEIDDATIKDEIQQEGPAPTEAQLTHCEPAVFDNLHEQISTVEDNIADAATEILPRSQTVANPPQDLMPGYDSHTEIIAQMLSEVKDLSDNLGTELSIDDDYVRYVMCNQQSNTVLSEDLQEIVSEFGVGNILFDGDSRSSVSYQDQSLSSMGTGHTVANNIGVPLGFGALGNLIPQQNVANNVLPPHLDLGFSDTSMSDASMKPDLHWEAIMRTLSEGHQQNVHQNFHHDVSSSVVNTYDNMACLPETESKTDKAVTKPRSRKVSNKENAPQTKQRVKKTKQESKSKQGPKTKGKNNTAKQSDTLAVVHESRDSVKSDREVGSSACDKLYEHLDNIIGQVCRSPVVRSSTKDPNSLEENPSKESNAKINKQSPSTTSASNQCEMNPSEDICDSSKFGLHDVDDKFVENHGNLSGCDAVRKDSSIADADSNPSSSSFYGFTGTDIGEVKDIQFELSHSEQGSSEQTVMYGMKEMDDLEFYDVATPIKDVNSSQGTVVYDTKFIEEAQVCGEGDDTRATYGGDIMDVKSIHDSGPCKNKDMIAEWLGDDAVMDNPHKDMMDTGALHRSSDFCHTDVSSSMRNSNLTDSLMSEDSSCSIKKKVSKRKKKVLTVEFSESESLASPCATPRRSDNVRSLRQCDTSIKKTKPEVSWQAMPSPSVSALKISKVKTPSINRCVENWTVRRSGDCKLTFSVDRGTAKYKSKPKVSRRRLIYDDDS